MGKLEAFEIHFTNNKKNVYFPGQTVRGVVILKINEPLRAKRINLEVIGCAETKWSESRTRSSSKVLRGSGTAGSHTYLETYSAKKYYLSQLIVLWPTGNAPITDGDALCMQPGSHNLPFNFQLPLSCPPSFEGAYGHIRYFVKAIIDRPWHFDNKIKVSFTVVGLVDLNQNHDASRPLHDFKSKRLGCFCCVSGHLSCSVRIDRSGYVPGELIPLNFEVTNSSSRDVSYVRARLVENVVFVARRYISEYRKISTRIVSEEISGCVKPGDTQYWRGRSLIVSALAPTLKNCSIIIGSYELQIKVRPAGCYDPMKLYFPIIIGNVPFRSTSQNIHELTSLVQADLAEPLPKYPDLPPPSYEEAVSDEGDTRNNGDEVRLFPKIQKTEPPSIDNRSINKDP